MTTFKMTFNKPAARQFIDGYEAKGLEIKVESGVVMFRPTKDHGDNTAVLSKRMRGGYEIVVEGTNASSLLANLQNPSGPFFTLEPNTKKLGWAICKPFYGADAPPKFTPHVRIWNLEKEETPKKVIVPAASDLDRVRWAYDKLSEPVRAGRPSNEIIEARQIKTAFEEATKKSSINLEAIIEASALIQSFINSTLKEMGNVDDAIATQNAVQARHALGLDEKPREVTKHISPNADLRSFGGGLAEKMAEGVLEQTS